MVVCGWKSFVLSFVGLDNEKFQVVDKISSFSKGWNEQSAMW